jgi:P4 family phage/plasmid primase-like protien
MSSSSSEKLFEFLRSHKKEEGMEYTNTRITDKNLNIYGGTYSIPDSAFSEFIKCYYNSVFVQGKEEYLTEKQLIANGPITIDIDFRYEPTIKERKHTEDHIFDIVMLYADKLLGIIEAKPNIPIDIFVMEKSKVNTTDPEKTKDGIHIIFGLKMHKGLQVILRNKVLEEIKEMWSDLPITNSWEDVLDEGITRGNSPWQLYGSRKPGNLAYIIKYHYILTFDEEENDWIIEKKSIESNFTEKYIEKLSARYTNHPEFSMKESVRAEFEKNITGLNHLSSREKNIKKLKKSVSGSGSISSGHYNEIPNEDTLDKLLEELFEDVGQCNYKIKETHQYTMSLPEKYYGPGSYQRWIKVGWALANTSPKLFLTWLKFSCQENCRDTLKASNGKFDWSKVGELYDLWKNFENNNPDGLTHRSIMYWSKNDVRDKYNKIQKETIDYFIEQTISTSTEFDLASVLFNIYKDDFICVSIKNNIWYEYINHRWYEIDSGNTLRLFISKDMHKIYMDKTQETMSKMQTMDKNDDSFEDVRKRSLKLAEICVYLRKTTWKNNIMREARELFYDKDFMEKLDQNPYLLCFNNYVVDFKNKIHRRGQPDDYISKCTNIDYIPYQTILDKHTATIDEINSFMKQLFPNTELCKYMWEHLASCLIGTNENQTFNIYLGGGANGKSKLTDLMSRGLGQLKATVPITLITQKRNTIGSTSSEIVQLNGIRYAVMQEPTKGDKINEGIMKEITGGDPIQGRALFKDTITFKPQFKLVVCTNTLFEDMSTDGGTWRRIRVCNFESKFLEKPYADNEFPANEFPHQFSIDKKLDDKFEVWAPIFMSMLIDISYKLQGNVKECKMVMSSSNKYRQGQDYLAEFAKDKIKVKSGDKINKTELLEIFKQWYSTNYGRGNIPKGREVTEYMEKRYGVYKQGWQNIAIIYDEEEFAE